MKKDFHVNKSRKWAYQHDHQTMLRTPFHSTIFITVKTPQAFICLRGFQLKGRTAKIPYIKNKVELFLDQLIELQQPLELVQESGYLLQIRNIDHLLF
ncbi:hypothetical protein CN526_24705 [Bacillus wiedmannii]|nr:hypothetical protein CN888_18685 [Bacillus wiedmannii]PEK60710.1 hypothetical protein CN595_14005 [Bacillus wiedmannii]PEU22599.1 hypothetical protein CN526_24705 [Bacillus wiedmannii]PHG40958.1 hypothetical protein COI54_27670 [Bacillus wiedmannii]